MPAAVTRSVLIGTGRPGLEGLVITAAAVGGLLVGSFLNVVVYRVPRGLSVNHPRSFCPRCATPVAGMDNIPVVSWVVLRGRCRHCAQPISRRYPLVEAGTGATFGLVAAAYGARWGVVGLCILAATLLAQVLIELDRWPIPPSVSFVGTAVGALALLGGALADGTPSRLVGAGVGVAAVGVVTLVVAGSVRRRAGQRSLSGLSALVPLGPWLGWLGPAPAAAGVVTGAAIAVVTGRAHDQIPLGLASAVGAGVALLAWWAGA